MHVGLPAGEDGVELGEVEERGVVALRAREEVRFVGGGHDRGVEYHGDVEVLGRDGRLEVAFQRGLAHHGGEVGAGAGAAYDQPPCGVGGEGREGRVGGDVFDCVVGVVRGGGEGVFGGQAVVGRDDGGGEVRGEGAGHGGGLLGGPDGESASEEEDYQGAT